MKHVVWFAVVFMYLYGLVLAKGAAFFFALFIPFVSWYFVVDHVAATGKLF